MIQKLSDGFYMASGTLPRDAEMRLVGDKQTPLCSFGIKVDEIGDTRTAVWQNCKCWRGLAEACQGLQKGDNVFVIGKLEERTFKGRDGEDKTTKEIVCEFVTTANIGQALTAFPSAQATLPEEPDFSEIEGNEVALPF